MKKKVTDKEVRELWPIVATIIIVLIIWLMPKHLTKQEIYVTWGVLAAITYFADIITGITFDWFDFGPGSRPELSTTILEILLPPSFGIIFLNYMPMTRSRYVLYLSLWVIFSVFFEWLSIKFHYLEYKGWKLWYSAIIYMCVFLFLRWHLRFIRNSKG